ncbi:MAG: bifunctional metallophosphatase/5'-nucleotidase [Comamonadaceae bacterium CG_4_9_14_3_um_filter_60_33]|nr:MAG: bifunctional metallophosphatase/5'-nucleotidase [Comamonadaceae bacterium CG_4_10_14_3_um_filter_60_42]PJB46318.1 MAG: bifunctional metallophosphatase/5'-nucleotidase [Comamonadaceae bacterium CG_4_9_14_3_um_filter_60_33]
MHKLVNSRVRLSASVFAVLGLTLSGCGGNDEPSFKPLELNIAHINDHHSQLEAFTATELTLDGVATQVELGGFARQTAMFKSVANTKNLLKLHAGDAITGSLYYTFFKGEADAQMMNSICFDAFTPGNHEFDDSDTVLKGFLDELAKGSCKTSAISSNIVAAAGTALAPSGGTAYLKPWVIKEIDGIKVGIVGITIAGKTVNSSRPLASTHFNDEVASAQKAIDELKAQGVRHIVALTHQGYDADKAMAAKLTDIDAIIGGDSHSLLGDFSAVGIATSSGSYPTVVTNIKGETVCIGQAWEYSKAFGLMNLQFNENGTVKSCGGKATLLIGDSFKRKDAGGAWQVVPEPERTTLLASLAANQPQVKVLSPDAGAVATLKNYSDQVAAEKAKPIGTATEALCLVRVPGESTNRSTGVAGCEAANTLARGSDAAQAVAEAFLFAAKRADFSLQNAGGVRIAVAAGSLDMNTAFTLLPFTNVLVEMSITGAEVVTTLEDAVANHLDAKQSSGSHPYAAGLRWDLDMSKTRGQRFSRVQVRNKTTGDWSDIDPAKTYVLVTNDFIAEGKDGYTTLGTVLKDGRSVNTYLLYTQSFVDYVLTKGSIARPARGDYAHQMVITQAGKSLP